MSHALAVLQNARNVITNESNWTKGSYARDANGETVLEDDESATCFCSLGAIRKAMTQEEFERGDFVDAREELVNTLAGRHWIEPQQPVVFNIPAFNDKSTTTHADVLALFDETIARLSKKG